jgi:hypothetical protein
MCFGAAVCGAAPPPENKVFNCCVRKRTESAPGLAYTSTPGDLLLLSDKNSENNCHDVNAT